MLLQVQLEEAKTNHAAAAAEASDAKQTLADKELLLVAAAPANGDMGEDAVCSHPSTCFTLSRTLTALGRSCMHFAFAEDTCEVKDQSFHG